MSYKLRVTSCILFCLLLSAFCFLPLTVPAQNTNLPVGAIPGVIDVSPMGAATYTVSIPKPPTT